MFRKFGLPLVALLALGFAVFHVVRAQQAPPKLRPPVEPARSPFGSGVAGAGLVEAKTENIAVGSHLPGVVTKVHVKVGDVVEEGQPLFELDDRALRAELATKEAAVESARAQLHKLKQMPRKEELPAMKARVDEAKATLADQEDLLARTRRLASQGAVGAEERVRREQAVKVARQQLRRAEADLELMKAGAWKPDLRVAEAALLSARAVADRVETEIERLQARARVRGKVLQVNVRPGEYVSTPASTPPVVLGSVDVLHVRVDIDENDIPRFAKGAPARATLRGDPRRELPLTFVRVEPYVIPKKSLTGDNTERVDTRVLQVIYALDSSAEGVYVGQQVDVYIDGSARRK
jgi:HlyD family secretion protein